MSSAIKQIEELIKDSPYKEYVGFEILHITPGELDARIKLLPYFKRSDGVAHGGITSYLADTVMGLAALTMVDSKHTVYTAEMKTSFLRFGTGKHLTAKGRVIKSGKGIQFCEAEVYGEKDGEQYLIAKATATMASAEKK